MDDPQVERIRREIESFAWFDKGLAAQTFDIQHLRWSAKAGREIAEAMEELANTLERELDCRVKASVTEEDAEHKGKGKGK